MTEDQARDYSRNGALLGNANTVRANKGLPALPALAPEMRLREDLGFDSLDLAELTARIDGLGRAA